MLAAATGLRVVVEDIETPPYWAKYRHLARMANVRACWSQPILGSNGAVLGSVWGDWLIKRVTATWTIRIGLLIEAGLHLTLATSRSAYVVGTMFFAFGVHAALWTIVGSSLRQRLTPPEMLGRVASTSACVTANRAA